MKKLLAVLLLSLTQMCMAQTCASNDGLFNNTWGNTFTNGNRHTDKYHALQTAVYGTCNYHEQGGKLPDGEYPCVGSLYLHASTTFADLGTVDSTTLNGYAPAIHRGVTSSTIAAANGSDTVIVGSIAEAVGTTECPVGDSGCTGGSIQWSGNFATYVPVLDLGTVIWSVSHIDNFACPALESPVSSPIVIPINGGDYSNAFTSVDKGIKFDFWGTENPVQMSWIKDDNKYGFLVLDRNHNGTIDNGGEMFGSITHQPLSEYPSTTHEPNGFLALAYFDDPAHGGNGDGVLNAKDKIFSELAVWERNDKSVTSDSDLIPLSDLGITEIGLQYERSDKVDRYGNQFRFKGYMIQDGNRVDIYDVILKIKGD